jgi:hypothetical protein
VKRDLQNVRREKLEEARQRDAEAEARENGRAEFRFSLALGGLPTRSANSLATLLCHALILTGD